MAEQNTRLHASRICSAPNVSLSVLFICLLQREIRTIGTACKKCSLLLCSHGELDGATNSTTSVPLIGFAARLLSRKPQHPELKRGRGGRLCACVTPTAIGQTRECTVSGGFATESADNSSRQQLFPRLAIRSLPPSMNHESMIGGSPSQIPNFSGTTPELDGNYMF
ncbi:hypothetical protein N658DRAFT_202210 [Parathielavia hyrcaniae]|uniref:Uncharacterized protein n=1 Tax=Parathielavia hyrcaniae TaxID=113614 RepID=A0AAN6QCT4_9PEZI|nr:hypothetical protein N658DRAFT_202210 [Parathielavia hyrcaniae]